MENESDKICAKKIEDSSTRNENGEQEGQGGHMVRHCGGPLLRARALDSARKERTRPNSIL